MIRACSVGDCPHQYLASGYCSKHYQRWKRHGDPSVVKPTGGARATYPTPIMDRFWPKVDITSDHWQWMGSKNGAGYGLIWSLEEGRDVMAHRVAWEWATGEPLSYDFQIDHLCRTPSCVNPAHLEPVTSGENIRRGRAAEAWRERCALITHCPQNHLYDEANTYINVRGARNCRTCQRNRDRKRRGSTKND